MAPSFPVEYSGNTKKCSQKGMSQMKEKKRRVSKGYSSGFIPEYRHAVDTMAESEGFGSSGRIDTEITASEDSCATKRRCISLNANSNDRFGVPVQVLSVSKMSLSERKNLELSLRQELEQIKALRKKIASLSSNGVAISPTSDIHSCSDGQRRQVPAKSQKPVGISASQGKKRAAPGRNGPHTKTPAAGRSDSVKQQLASPMNASSAMLMKQCETLLGRLMQHQHSWVFNTPVDVVKLNIPDYYNVIKHPMDLGTVKSKLNSGEYTNPSSFAADVRLTFSNAMTYNPKGNDVHYMAETLSKYFEIRWKQIEKKLHATKSELARSKSSVSMETETPIPMPQSVRSKSSVSAGNVKSMPRSEKSKSSVHVEAETGKPKPQPEKMIKKEPSKRVMTSVDKNRLSLELESLLAELPESIVEFLKENSSTGNQTGEDEYEIEIDIESLSDDTLFRLRKLLDDYLASKQRSQAKTEPRVMELQNESGFSNSSLQPCKGNDPVDEEIDIGGNDIPISSFPIVEIEKDTAVRNTRCSSSSSSSGDSASSSSDSDSGASSGSEADGAKTTVLVNTTKEIVGSGANIEQKKTNLGDKPNTEKHSLNELNQHEQDCESQPVCVEADGRLEGESAPPERPASPDKLYRAALLRSRFADTILKAQEKTTLGKDDKLDPEKLRLEKEELERRRKEEKARLKAEAKAAEEARKKAAAEAVAEAKRKRELEREAARQALQKMEKTVDINENCHFMGDLEMLGVAPDENMVHSLVVDETSPDHYSQDGLGSFKFQGNSNPLEQLGLYRKDDNDDEEEGGDPKTPVEVDDPEEGEID